MPNTPTKRCLRCARPFTDRRAIRDFEAVQYCSKGCRGRRFTGKRRTIALAILASLDEGLADPDIDMDRLIHELSSDADADWAPLVRQVAEAMSEHGEVRMRKR